MARTSLGKRSRSAMQDENVHVAVEEITPRATRSKRRTDFVIAADENENPFVSRKTRKTSYGATALDLDLDELAVENVPSPKKYIPQRTTPAKHGAPERRIPLSPKKAAIEDVIEQQSDVITKPPTPSTPRHRDALSKRIPITPRHRLGLVGKAGTPQTPRTPSTLHAGPNVYNIARKAFAQGVNPDRLIGREKERDELRGFIQSRLEKSDSGCMYISGPPGTGKSALVNEVCEEVLGEQSFKKAYINCMSVKTARDISSKLLEDFEEIDVLEGSETKALKSLFRDKQSRYLVVLDEIDHLLDVDIELLYQVFEWSMQSSSNLVVVGIANALDFTDRFLPRLKSRGLRPQLLPFMPYSVAQIASVLTSKLKTLLPAPTTATPDYVPFLHPAAIQFAAKKVAAQTGDLRKAFAISARALDLIETETRAALSKTQAEITPSPTPSPSKTPLMENMNLSSPLAVRTPTAAHRPLNILAHLTIETAPRATIAHMARVTAAVFSNGSNQRLTSLNLQQKAVLCSLAVLEKRLRDHHDIQVMATPSSSKSANGAPTVKALLAAYTSLCKTDNMIHALTNTEFRDVLASLETLSLISWVDGKNGTFAGAAPVTPSRRGRGGGFGAMVVEEKRVAGSVAVKELKESLKGPGADILLNLLWNEGL